MVILFINKIYKYGIIPNTIDVIFTKADANVQVTNELCKNDQSLGKQKFLYNNDEIVCAEYDNATIMDENAYKNMLEIAKSESLLYDLSLDSNIYVNNNAFLVIEIKHNTLYIKSKYTGVRATDICNFIKIVLKKSAYKLDGIYIIGLDDVVTQNGVLVFSKKINENKVLIPDLYSTYNYSGKLNINDICTNKKNKFIFIGSSTGSYNVLNNNRLKICNDSLKYSPVIECYINNITQINEMSIKQIYPMYNKFKHLYMSIQEQMEYKYIISIDGNSSAWDRIPWILNSKSVLVKQKSDFICWYYYLLKAKTHFLEFETCEDLMNIYSENLEHIDIIKNSNDFAHTYLNLEMQINYMIHILLNIKNRIVTQKIYTNTKYKYGISNEKTIDIIFTTPNEQEQLSNELVKNDPCYGKGKFLYDEHLNIICKELDYVSIIDRCRCNIYILTLDRDDRRSIFEDNKKKFPLIKKYISVNGYNKNETIDELKKINIKFNKLCNSYYSTYGTLANFLTKIKILNYQIDNNIKYMCFIEDDLLLDDKFEEFIEEKKHLLDNNDINMIRLDKWGEGYITTVESATRIISHIHRTGIIENIDNQLRCFCGKEMYINNTPWKLLVSNDAGDCLKTEYLEENFLSLL